MAEKAGDYAGARALEHRVWVLLFETFSGFGPACVSLALHTSLVELPPGDSWSSARAPHR